MKKSIVPINKISDAFNIFSQTLLPFIIDVRLEAIWFDIGDYTHLLKSNERLMRINWIRETIINPDEIRRSCYLSQPDREIYIKQIFKDESDFLGEVFIVSVDRKIGGLDFRTAFVAQKSYLTKLKQGRLLWRRKNN